MAGSTAPAGGRTAQMYAQAAPGSLSRPDHFKMKLMVQLRHAMVAGDSGPGHQLQPKLCAVGRPTVVAGVLAKRFLLVLESRVASTGHLIRELQPVPGGGSSEQNRTPPPTAATASPREITPPKYSQHWDPIKFIFESN